MAFRPEHQLGPGRQHAYLQPVTQDRPLLDGEVRVQHDALPLQLFVCVALGLFVATAVGVFFGVYPARKASLLDPIVALRSEL